MARIDPELLQRLQDKLGLSQPAVYARIQRVANDLMLERPEAALALAASMNINISRYASREQRLQIAAARGGGAPATRATEAPIAVEATGTRLLIKKRALKKPNKKRGKSVFVVQGRNNQINKAMFSFLRALHLQPIEWEKAIAMTEEANPYIGDVLDKAFDKASAVVVLMTPDDEARLKEEFRSDHDEEFESELRGQPRPNVLFEAGFAISRYPDQTVLVSVGKLRPFSDIQGKHVARLDNSAERRKALASRLKTTGLDVDMDGVDWLSEGDFELEQAKPKKKPGRVKLRIRGS